MSDQHPQPTSLPAPDAEPLPETPPALEPEGERPLPPDTEPLPDLAPPDLAPPDLAPPDLAPPDLAPPPVTGPGDPAANEAPADQVTEPSAAERPEPEGTAAERTVSEGTEPAEPTAEEPVAEGTEPAPVGSADADDPEGLPVPAGSVAPGFPAPASDSEVAPGPAGAVAAGPADQPLPFDPLAVDGDADAGPAPLGDDELESALEALLLVVDSPVEEEALAGALGVTPLRVAEHLRLLSNRYADQDRGIDLRRAGGGWRFYTRDRYAPYVEKLLLDGQRAKLTRAALETLAVIAYRQPVTRARVAAVRGVNCDGVIRTLLARGLVEETGTDQETGGFLYRTTELFLERLGLSSLEDLPPIAPLLPEVDSIDEL